MDNGNCNPEDLEAGSSEIKKERNIERWNVNMFQSRSGVVWSIKGTPTELKGEIWVLRQR